MSVITAMSEREVISSASSNFKEMLSNILGEGLALIATERPDEPILYMVNFLRSISGTLEPDIIGERHTFKKYDRFALNTNYFVMKY